MRVKVDPKEAAKEFAEFSRRMQQGRDLLDKTRDKDVQIATTPKAEVFRTDKTVLYRYKATAKQTVRTPVLMVYGLIGRYTMADLQEDRSLVRNLLAQGVDLYVAVARRPVAHARGLHRRLPRGLRGVHPQGPGYREGEPAGHLRRRRLHRVLCGAQPAEREEPRPHHHAHRLPCGR